MEGIFTSHNISILAFIAAALPLISFAGIILFTKPGKGAVLAIANIALSFVISVLVFRQVWNKGLLHSQWHWFTVGGLNFDAGILLNNLSVLMLLLVSGIALLIHIYSLQYMKNDPFLHRYWAYLGLFCFSMLSLVIADNLLLVYMFWELVGFSSYLLIGFWFTREAAALAAKKAFIINRIGDLGFLTGLMILLSQFHTLDIHALFGDSGLVHQSIISSGVWKTPVSQMPAIWLTVAGIALFMGAAAKSAQFPFHTWLPDAMEGPTAVSSLIHAATMVAAGVFLLARVYPIFDPFVLNTIVVIGGFTAFMASTIALVQNDIKKILAFSTISQLGFMILAMGVGAYSAAIFHLATHAFFKCLLFLAAGAVIHEMHHVKEKYKLDFDVQNIQLMGGLRKKMPLTFVTMLIASLALAGIPLTSGYLSKDAILIHTFEWSVSQNGILKIFPYIALLSSWLTIFYISRLIFKVFFGDFRLDRQFNQIFSVHESPAAMRFPMAILAAFCLFPVFSSNPLLFEHTWLLNGLPLMDTLERVNAFHTIVPALVNLVGVFIIYWTYAMYVRQKRWMIQAGPVHRFLEKQWLFNEAYHKVFVAGTLVFSRFSFWFDRNIIDGVVNLAGKSGLVLAGISAWTDQYIIDRIVNLLGTVAKTIGNAARRFQTGRLQQYLITMLLLLVTFFLIKYFSQTI